MKAFLEDYTLLGKLGDGGFATVFKVKHNQLGYIRAIRVLNATIASEDKDELFQKFLEECKLLLRLGNGTHPNVVHIYQPLLRAQKAFVEMDYIDGCDIHQFIEMEQFVAIDDVLHFIYDIGSALFYCHHDLYRFCMDRTDDALEDDPSDGSKVLITPDKERELVQKYRVIHNDIHSGNIMRREDGRYVLLDFGLSISNKDVVRSSIRRNGAPEYKAPEKWDDEMKISTQSDIYSFGVVLYEMLTGTVPFPFDKSNVYSLESEYKLGLAHKTQLPPSIFEARKHAFEKKYPDKNYEKDYPDWVEELTLKCLEKNIDNRYPDGKAMNDFISSHKGSIQVVTDNSKRIELEQSVVEKDKLIKGLRSKLVLVCSFLALIIAIIIGAIVLYNKPNESIVYEMLPKKVVVQHDTVLQIIKDTTYIYKTDTVVVHDNVLEFNWKEQKDKLQKEVDNLKKKLLSYTTVPPKTVPEETKKLKETQTQLNRQINDLKRKNDELNKKVSKTEQLKKEISVLRQQIEKLSQR